MISILMPFYNGIEFLHESVSSVINQSMTSWELLIGINGHDENSCKSIIKKITVYRDKRIKYFIFQDKNKSKTLNLLIAQAKYDNICLLDVDDFWYPEKLRKQYKYHDRYDVIGADSEYFGKIKGSPGLFLGKLSPSMFRFQNPIINSAAMLKKSDAYWDETWEGLDDYNLWIDLLNKGKTFYNVPELLVKHRIHDKSFFNNKNQELNKKLLEEKIPQISEEELEQLGKIMDEKAWIV